MKYLVIVLATFLSFLSPAQAEEESNTASETIPSDGSDIALIMWLDRGTHNRRIGLIINDTIFKAKPASNAVIRSFKLYAAELGLEVFDLTDNSTIIWTGPTGC